MGYYSFYRPTEGRRLSRPRELACLSFSILYQGLPSELFFPVDSKILPELVVQLESVEAFKMAIDN